jgi:hypothetical protein
MLGLVFPTKAAIQPLAGPVESTLHRARHASQGAAAPLPLGFQKAGSAPEIAAYG